MPKKQTMVESRVYSAGARYERAAFRGYLRRQLAAVRKGHDDVSPEEEVIQDALLWVLERQRRYDKRAGGL